MNEECLKLNKRDKANSKDLTLKFIHTFKMNLA